MKRKELLREIQERVEQRKHVELEIIKVLEDIKDNVVDVAKGLENAMGPSESI